MILKLWFTESGEGFCVVDGGEERKSNQEDATWRCRLKLEKVERKDSQRAANQSRWGRPVSARALLGRSGYPFGSLVA